jgi:predicted RNA binding protein YcfA (HicA-like mRNA interferase family)
LRYEQAALAFRQKDCQSLRKIGYYRVSRKGSHIKIHNDVREITLIIPDHKEVDRWTLRGIIKDAELTVEEFIELLE